MKKKKIENVDLAFPCQQEWHGMKADGQKKICEKCSSCVHDFTNITTDEMDQVLNDSSELVCGMFKKSQLSETFIKYAASTFIVATSLTLPVLGQEVGKANSVNRTNEKEEIFLGIVVEEHAFPKDGYEEFYRKINNELKYLDQPTKKGKVFIQFTIDTIGNVVDAVIIKGLNEVADKEALRAFLAVNEKFEPAKQRGKPVRMKMVLPITLDPEKVKEKK